jgi:chromate transporter
VNPVLLYLFLLKATVTSFSGLASFPIIRADLVLNRHVLTDEQLNTAVIVSRTTPGPVGVYVVSVGFAVAGLPGAIAGWAAMCTPALLVVPLIHFASRQAAHRRMRGATHAVVAASAGLLIAAVVPLAREALTDALTITMAVVCAVLMVRKVNPFWLVAAASLAGMITALIVLR